MDLDWNVEFYFLTKLLLFINHKKVLNNYYFPKQLLIYIIEVIDSFFFVNILQSIIIQITLGCLNIAEYLISICNYIKEFRYFIK